MPHVTFIHGIANKPPEQKLLKSWEYYLSQGGLNLGAKGVSTSMVFWANVMYATPSATDTDYESVDGGLGTSETDEELAWIDGLPDEEKAFVESMIDSLGFQKESPEGDDYIPPPPGEDDEDLGEGTMSFEAIPLPWAIKRRLMKRLLKDVHHYLFNASFSPRPGETYQVQDHIRKLFVDQLKRDASQNDGGRHVVVSHSMGTVIAYDCLKNVPGCTGIDALMTVGSPLGISEVHDNFKPKYSKKTAFPSSTVSGEWVNVYDRLDPVAFDARIANDYQKDEHQVITDQRVHNSGKWRHSSWNYFGQEKLCDHLKRLLNI